LIPAVASGERQQILKLRRSPSSGISSVWNWKTPANFQEHCADRERVNPAAAPSPGGGKPVPRPGTNFVARQPILTADEKVFGYELLFRDGVEDFFSDSAIDADVASRSTLNTSMLLGLDALCDGRRAFVNCTRDILLKDYITLLPSGQTVVEVLETVPADDLVVAACRRLKEAGYMIALDDFAVNDPREALTDLADIIKVDLRATSADDVAAMANRYGPWRCRMLAEKVETREEFVTVNNAGFRYFQGYFFRRPETLTAHEIPGNRLNYLRMLTAVSQPELDLRGIENLVKSETSLCYRLLRYLNSAAFGFGAEIHSVRHALSILGEREVRRWIRLVATLGAGQDKASDLVLASLVRARFCEQLSPKLPHADSDLFLMGMLSLMDNILEIPMQQVLDNVPLDHESKAVLLGGASRLRPFYQLMLAQESGEWETMSALASQLHLSENDVAESYWQALQWARQVSAGA
jgi:c-di-GMP-related signal transduction protein